MFGGADRHLCRGAGLGRSPATARSRAASTSGPGSDLRERIERVGPAVPVRRRRLDRRRVLLGIAGRDRHDAHGVVVGQHRYQGRDRDRRRQCPDEESCVDFNPILQITREHDYTASYTSNSSYQVMPGLFQSRFVKGHLSVNPNSPAQSARRARSPSPNPQEDGYAVDVAFSRQPHGRHGRLPRDLDRADSTLGRTGKPLRASELGPRNVGSRPVASPVTS